MDSEDALTPGIGLRGDNLLMDLARAMEPLFKWPVGTCLLYASVWLGGEKFLKSRRRDTARLHFELPWSDPCTGGKERERRGAPCATCQVLPVDVPRCGDQKRSCHQRARQHQGRAELDSLCGLTAVVRYALAGGHCI